MPQSRRRTPGAKRTAIQRAEESIEQIRKEVAAMDYVCTGTLHQRTKSCGKPTCACATDRRARHGPYYEWTRRERGRLAHTVLPATAVELLRRAIKNNQRLRKLVRAWERESMRVAQDPTDE